MPNRRGATLPQVLYMLTSGSEANDLAWRIARAAAAAADPDDTRPLHVAVVSWEGAWQRKSALRSMVCGA